MEACNHNIYYLLTGQPTCLHRLFENGSVQAITREVTRDGVEFHIWRERLVKNKKGRYAGKYRLFGTRCKIYDYDQIVVAIELAEKYNIQKVRL